MKENIERLEAELTALKEAYAKRERDEYRRQKHKTFKVGEWVKKGERFGKVGWVENSAMNITEEMGYCGIDLRSERGGFIGGCKRDEWELIEGEELSYFTEKHKLEIELTGEQLQDLIMRYRYCNQSNTTKQFFDILCNTGK